MTSHVQTIIKMKDVTLKNLGPADVDWMVEELQCPQVLHWLGNPNPYYKRHAEELISERFGCTPINPNYELGIFFKGEGIGQISVRGNDTKPPKIFMKLWIARRFWGSGISYETCAAFLKYYDHQHPTVPIGARIQMENMRACKFFEKLNFKCKSMCRMPRGYAKAKTEYMGSLYMRPPASKSIAYDDASFAESE